MIETDAPRTRPATEKRLRSSIRVIRRSPRLALLIAMFMLVGTAQAATSGGVDLTGPNSGVTVPTWDDYLVLEDRVKELENRVAESGEDQDSSDPAMPSATFTYTPEAPVTEETIVFDGTGSDCAAEPCSYAWTGLHPDGGDETWHLGQGEVLEFAFEGAGEKHVELEVTDDGGHSDTHTEVFDVAEGEQTSDGSDDTSGDDTDSGASAYTYDSETTGVLEIPEGYPNPDTAGYQGDEGALPVVDGPVTLDQDGERLEGVFVRGAVIVKASDVTIRNSVIEAPATVRYGLDATDTARDNLTVEDTTVRIVGGENWDRDADGRPAYGAVVRNAHLQRVAVYGGETTCFVQSSTTLSHTLCAEQIVSPGGHNDAVQTCGGSDITLSNVTALGRYESQTSAMILRSWCSGLYRLTVEDSFLHGGNYAFYDVKGDHPNVDHRIVNNLWNADSWQYGPTQVDLEDTSELHWEGNRTTDGDRLEP